MKNFQLITIVVFIALAIFGVLVFSGAIPIGSNDNSPGGLGAVVLWGTVKAQVMAPLLEDFNNSNPTFVVKYVEKRTDTFDKDLLEALAGGTGPDMFFLPDNLAFHYANKIVTIPYQSYPLSAFKNNFASAGEVFLNSRGTLAFPLSVDPLMMYYNRSIFNANGVVLPPVFWDEVLALVPTLDKRNDANSLIKSAVALGQFSNINNAKDLLATLFMQAGNPIVSEKEGVFSSTLSTSNTNYSLDSILKFYTDFANPNSPAYSWNRSFSNSSDAFSQENLALYFGFASELASLINKNPNQDFLMAPIPQIKNSNFKVTTARVLGLAILSSSKNLNTALTAAGLLTAGDFALRFAIATGTAPARRDLLAVPQTDAYAPIFYNSALYTKSWLDPSPKDTNDIFRGMIDGVLSNATNASQAVKDASSKLDLLLLR